MRSLLILTIALGCGGPSQQQLAETPSATTRPRAVEAPPASTSDKDRERLTQQFDDQQTTQNAYREARGEANKPPPGYQPKGSGKKAPVEQAPLEPVAPTDEASQAPGASPPR